MIRQPNRTKPGSQPKTRSADIAIGVVTVIAIVGWYLLGGFGARADQISITTASGTHKFTVEWAIRPEDRARGLMERTDLPEDHGMVFDFEREREVSFWMKNTPLPLDIIFIHGDGTVYRIERGTTPYSEAMIPSGAPVRFVLEVNAGIADKIDLKPGDRVRLTPPDPQ